MEAELIDGAGELLVGESALDVQDGPGGGGNAEVAVAADVLAGEGLGAVSEDPGPSLLGGHRDLGARWPDADAPERRRGVMAQDGVRPARQDRCHGCGEGVLLHMAEGVDTRVDPFQAAVFHPPGNGLRRQPELQQLSAGHMPVSPISDPRCLYA